jgi:hypothetical protein
MVRYHVVQVAGTRVEIVPASFDGKSIGANLERHAAQTRVVREASKSKKEDKEARAASRAPPSNWLTKSDMHTQHLSRTTSSRKLYDRVLNTAVYCTNKYSRKPEVTNYLYSVCSFLRCRILVWWLLLISNLKKELHV